ncbi:putative smad nuclear-interacting protein 1 [Scophthalmus maximus]|uniref:Putative smad nuclear-interacting protein 1 n=1 Tax=Scophthalmus maximus TaxID=52904 RepID=A0A2U9AWZ2_SCOMX|nr:putative smad nuclear-interacting protein 1 [Scophthalmus maximus]
MTKEKRHRRRESPERESKVKIKQEKVAPLRVAIQRHLESPEEKGHQVPGQDEGPLTGQEGPVSRQTRQQISQKQEESQSPSRR